MKFNSTLTDLKISRVFFIFGQLIYNTFETIFVYKLLNENIPLVFFVYAFNNILYVIFVHKGAQFISKIGLKKTMIIGILFLILHRIVIFLITFSVFNFLSQNQKAVFFVLFATIFSVAYRVFYWPAYNVKIGSFLSDEKKGREISFFYAITGLIGVLAPFLGGVILQMLSMNVIAIISILSIFLSIIPLIKGQDVKTTFSLSFSTIFDEIKTNFFKIPYKIFFLRVLDIMEVQLYGDSLFILS